ncbi:hypothetical protein DQ237_04965 [Blastococcus sp. TF02-8]|uniref:hypothetical protein n=1 Tax=Blastococcus sp. TF02-8 TaxID=2250574 RepID=UPI000DE9555B|nr:hypothetical protein [Blastococcus sp. TF02-8]RBY96958.1 hypothetical protein DQ237_04965 [Blastococcus sp. TF02-8]
MRIRRLALIPAAALLLAGCGGSDESDKGAASSSSSESGSELSQKKASEVVDASFTALENAGAVHVSGSVEEGGVVQELDMQFQGEDASGSITMGGVAVQLVLVGGQAYVQAPAEFWTSSGVPEEFSAQLDGQWVLMPPEAAQEFGSLTLSGLVDTLRSSGGDSVRGKVTSDEVDGEKVVVVTQADGSSLTALDDEENPYPVRIEDKGDEPATVEFSGFGETTQIVAPPNPLDLNTLGG